MNALRKIVISSLGIAIALSLPSALAQKYPEKPIRLIVQSPAGGTADLIARLIAQKLSERLGQPVIADNRAGAAGTVSAEITAQRRLMRVDVGICQKNSKANTTAKTSGCGFLPW